MCFVYFRGWSKYQVSYDSKHVAHADWQTDLHDDLIERTGMIERI